MNFEFLKENQVINEVDFAVFYKKFKSGFSTFLLVLGSVMSSDMDASDKVWLRLIQISMAVIYVVIAFRILDYFEKQKKQKML